MSTDDRAGPRVFRALILCNGEPPSRARFERRLRQADVFIAADGGGRVAKEVFEARPDHIIGDLDSYDSGCWPEVTPIHRPDQETNDLEKALELALELGATHARILGATGKRLDHTLKNLSVLKAYDRKLTLCMEDEHATIVLVTERLTVRGQVGQPVSLFPLSGRVTGITTRGLTYALHGEVLENGVRDGSSNALSAEEAEIRVSGGDLLVLVGQPTAVR